VKTPKTWAARTGVAHEIFDRAFLLGIAASRCQEIMQAVGSCVLHVPAGDVVMDADTHERLMSWLAGVEGQVGAIRSLVNKLVEGHKHPKRKRGAK
jgi:hypothetical protein